ncbi:transposase [Asanoa sp. WMMD1127]|uniref:transposase n=1 Tax=Asanoa sp. WMMD1127 TaxID=3016107 RepID=UPI0024169E8D|nr:transposase [Asanoa sp. WMMD1127]MDG4822783.1 transposase [Asanoa sp. WMMD1127]
MALVRVYCGLASAEPTGRPATAGTGLTAAVVDDAGRLLDVCEITDDPAGYAELGALLAERANGPGSAAIAADSDDHEVTSLLSAAGRPLAIADDDAVDDFAERFADDESLEEMESPAAERRAVGLARALQAGAIFAVGLPVPRDLAPYRPVLAAHSALAGGRHSAAATLREVLRELYPAALRAYSDPAEPLTLAVLDALPEPGLVSGVAARGRDLPATAEAVVKRLAADGLGDEAEVAEAITALRVAIAETPRRGTISKALASASADAVRQAVAAVRSCDEGCAALVATLAARTTPITAVPRRPMRRAAATTETTEPAATPAGLHALPVPLPERGATGRRHRPEPAAAATTPRALTTPPVAPTPVTPPPTAPAPVTSATPFAEPAEPAARAASPARPPNAGRRAAEPRNPAARAADQRTPGRSTESRTSRSTERNPNRSAETAAPGLTTPTPSGGTPMPSRSPGHAWSTGFDGTSRYQQPRSATPQPPTPATLQPPTPLPAAPHSPAAPHQQPESPAAAQRMPAAPQSPAAGRYRATPEAPAAERYPAAPHLPAAPHSPAASHLPAAPHSPAADRYRATPETPATERYPAAPHLPAAPAADRYRSTPEAPAAERYPAAPHLPAAPHSPAADRYRATPETPATERYPAAPHLPAAPQLPAASQSPADRYSTAPRLPATPQSPAASTTPLPGRPVSASPANKPVSVPPPPPGITPIPAQRPTVPPAEAGEPFRATLTNAALNSARAERKRPTVIPPRANGRAAGTPPPPQPPVTGFQATDLSVPVPAPRPEPGARANWPLVDNTSDDRANGDSRFPDLSELPPSELDRPTYSAVGDDRVPPPWLADDMPPEPPILRLVEPPPLADRALRDDSPRETRNRDRRNRDDYAARYDAPPLRLVESPSDTGSHQLPIGISAPPVSDEGDGDLLIFAAARSAWFTGHPDESEDLAWASVADTGWQAAEKASSPAVGVETKSGLPRRVPQANLVPGSPLREERPLRIVRDAASIAAHTTGYFRGWRRGQEIGGYAVGGRPGRESAGGWDFSRDHGGRDESQEYEYRSART